MSSRLDRLLLLLDTGSTPIVRSAAAKQLGDIQQSHPQELHNLLQKVYVYLQSKSWETRVAAGEAIHAIVSTVPLWSGKVERENEGYLVFQKFHLEEILTNGTPLLGSAGSEFDAQFDQAVSQKQRLSKELGLNVGNVNFSDELFNEEDFKVTTPTPTSDLKQSISNMLDGDNLSARERNKAKRKAKQLSRQNSVTQPREPAKRQKTMESVNGSQHGEDTPPTSLDWMIPDVNEWSFETVVSYLLEDILCSEWEMRHGAAIGIRSIVRKHRYTRAWLVDICLRLVTVLALDRFGDYVSHEVVAPVRETVAQVLGILTGHMSLEDLLQLQNIFLHLLKAEEWQARHGGLLAIKYLLAARQDISDSFLTELLPHIIQSISDNDDDVRAVAAASLLPVAHTLHASIPDTMLYTLTDKLWESLSVIDDLSASTNSIISLLSALISHSDLSAHYTSQQNNTPASNNLETLTPRLTTFISHNIRAVRRESLTALHVLLKKGGSWIEKVAALFARVLFQRLFLETDDAFHGFIIQVWDTLLRHTSQPTRTKIVTDHLPLWIHLLGAPAGLVLDQTLFLKHASTVSLSIPLGAREYTIKCALSRALGIAANVTTVSLFTPHILSALNSGCASHKQAGCLVAMEIIKETKEDDCTFLSTELSAVLQKLTGMLTEALTFDELLAANQNLQIACRGLLTLAEEKPPLKPFSQLPAFSVDHALALVATARQAGLTGNEVCAVEALAQSLSSSTVILSTRVYSLIAGCLIQLSSLPDKLNPVIKPIMDCIKKETSPELQSLAAVNLQQLMTLVASRTPCPTPKIVKNLISSLLEERVVYPLIETMSNPFLFLDLGTTPGSSTPSTPSTPQTPHTPEVMCTLSSLTKCDGMVTYVKYTTSTSTRQGRGRCKKECDVAVSPQEETKEQVARRGAEITLTCLSDKFKADLLDKVSILHTEVFSVLGELETENTDTQYRNKVIAALYVLQTLYPTLSESLKQQVLGNLENITLLLRDKYTAVRHAAGRLVTTIAQHNTVEAFNYLLTNVMKYLESSDTAYRQGVMECVHSLVKKLELDIVPYVVLLVVPMLKRMGDSRQDIRSLATLTFAQLVKLMPLDGVKLEVPGLLPELVQEKSKQKVFLEQLMDPSQIEDCDIPIKINAKLRKYQQDGVNWLWFLCKFGLQGILCDDMGLGKTLQTLCIIGTAHVNRTQLFHDEPLPSLVVCPPTLIGHWFYETEKFVAPEDLRPLMYYGNSIDRVTLQNKIKSEKYNLIICSYDVLRNDSDFFTGQKWNYCVLDEGHVIKNTKTKIAQALRNITAHHRLILSGTPIQNNVLELWGLFDWLMPGFLGNERQFQDQYSKPIQMSRDAKSSSHEQEAGALAMESLHRQVLPFLLRRLKDDVLSDLPPKIIQDYYCTLTPLQKELYDKFSESVGSADLGTESDVHVFQSLFYLRKVCNHPIMVLPKTHDMLPKLQSTESISHSGKLMALKQLLVDCGIGSQVVSPHRALVFCQLKSMLDIIEEYLLKLHLPSVSYLRLDGSTPAVERVPLVNKFNSDPSYDLLLLTTSVGGLGLNLTGADTVIFVEHDWNPSKDLQAMDRAHRIGQKRVVNVYRLITKDTLEERIMGLQKFKLNIANTVISSENSSLQQMGNSGLLDLFNGDKSKDEKSKEQKKKGLSAMLDGLGELWNDSEYEKEYDLKSFMESLGRTSTPHDNSNHDNNSNDPPP